MKPESLYPTALYFVKQFVKGSNNQRILRHFLGYETLDDVAMDVVVKVLNANPNYLTKGYIKIAAKCVCINKLKKKQVPWAEIKALFDENNNEVSLEDLIESEPLYTVAELEEQILEFLGEEERETYDALLTNQHYPELAHSLGVSTRTLERRVHDLKYKLHFILNEEDPEEAR